MNRRLRVMASIAGLFVLLSVLALVTESAGKPAGPYLSALADLAAVPALAAPGCAFKVCSGPADFRKCVSEPTSATNCVRFSSIHRCNTVAC